MPEPVKTEEQTTEQTQDQPKYLTAEEANAVWTAREKRYEASRAKEREEMKRQFDELRTALEQRQAEPDKHKKGEPDPEMVALRRRLDESEKRAKQLDDEREAEKQKRLRDEEDQTLRSALRRAGIDDEDLIEGAAALHLSKKAIVRDELGKPGFKRLDKFGNEEIVAVEKGIADWAASPQGKKYVPALGAGGSGTRPRNDARGSGPKDEKSRAQSALLRLAGARFPTEG